MHPTGVLLASPFILGPWNFDLLHPDPLQLLDKQSTHERHHAFHVEALNGKHECEGAESLQTTRPYRHVFLFQSVRMYDVQYLLNLILLLLFAAGRRYWPHE